jgi:glycosyltransferase involved in cell wall biosynthesis
MENILFIFNGGTGIGMSGGLFRLFEIIKYTNTKRFKINILTTPNDNNLMEKMKIPCDYKYLINYYVDESIKSQLTISLKSFFQLPKELKKYKGIVYSSCEHLYDVLPALRLKIFNKCKWYAVYHWVEDYPWIEKRGDTPFLRRYVYWLNRVFSGFLIKRFADKILAVSDQTKEKLIKIKKIKPEKIKAVYCGVNYNEIVSFSDKYKKEKGEKYDAVFMKRLDCGKGIFDLLEIWEYVVSKKHDAKLAIIGSGSESTIQKIKNIISNNKLENNIYILGVILDLEEKFRILNSAKIFVLPSHEENWAIVIGEAMAIKLPVLCYQLKEIFPIWKDNVEWINFGDINDFSNKILDYLSNKEKRFFLSNKAFDFIKKYDWKKIAGNEF